MSFGKIFESTFTGSMAGSGPVVFSVWAYVIANARPPGTVELNPVILSAIIGAPKDDIDAAINVLKSEDPASRTKDHNGRRLIEVGAFLYEVPTWSHYREHRNDSERRAYMAEAQRKHRAKRKTQRHDMSKTNKQSKPPSTQAEAEAEAEEYAEKEVHPPKADLSFDLNEKTECEIIADEIRTLQASWRKPLSAMEESALFREKALFEGFDFDSVREWMASSPKMPPTNRLKFVEEGGVGTEARAATWQAERKEALSKKEEISKGIKGGW